MLRNSSSGFTFSYSNIGLASKDNEKYPTDGFACLCESCDPGLAVCSSPHNANFFRPAFEFTFEHSQAFPES